MSRCSYDPAGNLVSVVNGPAVTVRVLGVSPKRAAQGSPVTVLGSGLSPSLAGNSVSIGGVAATVTSASKSRLVVTMPAGASGVVSVTAPGGTATGTAVVQPPVAVPVVSGVSAGVAAPGSTVTIPGRP